MASVRSEPVSRPSTPRVDVAAILAGAKANRDRCREARQAAQVYRWQPRRAWAEPEPEPEPEPELQPLVPSSEDGSDDEQLCGGHQWTEAKSSELATFDPLAVMAKSASPPSTDRPREGSPGGRGRRVEHTATRQLNQGSCGKPRSRGRRRIEQARAYAESGDLESSGSPQRAEGKMASLPPSSEEGLSDSEYTEADLDEIASTQAHLQRGFEDLMAQCDLMLQADSGTAELESLQGAMAAVAHRLQTLDGVPREPDPDAVDEDSDAARRRRGDSGSERTNRSKTRGKGTGDGAALSEARQQEIQADLELEIDLELEATAAQSQRRQRLHAKQEGGSRARRRSGSASSAVPLENDTCGDGCEFGGSELGSARRTVSTKGKGSGAKAVFSTTAAAAAGGAGTAARASNRKPPRR
jgi:hypothetical protein